MHAKLDGVRCTRLNSHVNVKLICKVPNRRCQACATNGSDPQPTKSQNAARGSGEHKPSIEGGGILGLAYESERTQGQIVKSQGLHRAPLSGGVKTATTRFDLPTPPVAVRNLVELARFGHLSTTMSNMHHRRAGYPFGTLVDFSVDGAGHPVFCLSPLAIHSRNLLEEPRASLVVQMPGWTGLANARVTIFGDVYPLAQEQQAAARDIFFAKHSSSGSKERWVSGNFVYFRMNRIVDIYFVGGFGTVQWITPADFLSSRPDDVVLDHPMRTLQMLSETFGPDLKALMAPDLGKPGQTIDELMFISIDANGVDVRLRVGAEFTVERINFGTRVTTAAGAVEAIKKVVSGEKAQQAQQAQQHK